MVLRRLFAAASFLLCASTFAAQPLQPTQTLGRSPNRALSWRLLGPFRGGRVLAVTGVPGEPEHFYFGSVNGGVWETQDAGRTWLPIFDSQPIGSIGAIAVAPSDPKVLYVGSGEADMRSDIAQGDGMYKSTDGGRSWKNIGLRDSQQIGRVIVHPSNANVVFVAALGHPYAANAERGVFRSRDGGGTWQKVLGPDSDTGAIDVAFEPGNPNVLYAALWQTRRTPWSIYPPSNGPKSGLFKSTDGGDHWIAIKGNGFAANPGRIGIAVARTQPNRVYAIVDGVEAGMYRSDDRGAHWTRTSDDERISSRGWYFGEITVEPKNADVVYSCNVNLYRSDDGGRTFDVVKGAPGGDDYHELRIDPQDPARRILGVDQGTVVSINGGKSWSSWYNQPTGQFYHVITDNRFPYWIYGSQQDSGSAAIPSRTNHWDGINLTEFREITAGGESDNVAPDPLDPDIIYGGRVSKLNMRTKQTKVIDPTMSYLELVRRTWTLPLVFSRRDPKVLYFGNQRVFRTDNGGEHWSTISGDLTREEPGIPPNLDPTTATLTPRPGSRHGVVYAIAPSRVADHDIWVGTDDGLIWRTRDEGSHWENITPAALTSWSKVGIIDTSHFDSETAYAAVDRHRLDDVRPYIYRTHDGGKTWTLIASGIPDGSFVNAVREDTVRKGLLYAGTEKGVYVSLDDGDHWQSLQLNLPVTSVRDLDVHGNDVVIATHGRGFWVMDNVTPLRQIDSAPVGQPFLFRPADAVREKPAGFTGTPMPKDEPMASNPPFGASIDYLLPADAREVKLTILDGQGSQVRSYSSNDAPPSTDPKTIKTAPEWVPIPTPLATTAGLHRFTWPLRYDAPAGLATNGVWSDGVWAPPSTYTAVLNVDGRELRQPLVVVADPRVIAPASAYAEQFAMAKDIEAVHAALTVALKEAEDLVDPKSAASATDKQRAFEISGVSGGDGWWALPMSTTSLRYLGDRIDKLVAAVDNWDSAPSPDARQGWAKVKPLAEAAVKHWNEFTAGLKR